MIVVQLVEIGWTKRSRGGPGAERRARLPRGFRLPAIPAPFLLHQVSLDEWNDFAMREREERGERPRAVERALTLRSADDGMLCVDFVDNALQGGHPWRAPRPDVFRLAPGQFGRLTINTRHASEDAWLYTEQVYNVCHGAVVPVDRFVDATPDVELDLRDALS